MLSVILHPSFGSLSVPSVIRLAFEGTPFFYLLLIKSMDALCGHIIQLLYRPYPCYMGDNILVMKNLIKAPA